MSTKFHSSFCLQQQQQLQQDLHAVLLRVEPTAGWATPRVGRTARQKPRLSTTSPTVGRTDWDPRRKPHFSPTSPTIGRTDWAPRRMDRAAENRA